MAEYLSDKEQEERLIALIKKHGVNVLIAILLGLSAFFGYQYWQGSKATKLANASVTYSALEKKAFAITPQSSKADKQTFLKDVESLVAASPDSIYTLKALFLQAQYFVGEGDLEQAKKTLAQASAIDAGDPGLKAIIQLRMAQVALAQKKYDDAQTALGQVNLPSFEASKQELVGDVFAAQNDTEAAKKAYTLAWDALAERNEQRVGLKLKMESLGLNPKAITPPAIIDEAATQAMMQLDTP